jgi:hypothetical protein
MELIILAFARKMRLSAWRVESNLGPPVYKAGVSYIGLLRFKLAVWKGKDLCTCLCKFPQHLVWNELTYFTESVQRCYAISDNVVTTFLIPTLIHCNRATEIQICYRMTTAVTITIRGCIQNFPDWPSGARTVNGTALCHWVCCFAILWVSIVSFVAITLRVASQRVFIFISVYFVIDSVRKLLDTPSYFFPI